MSIAAVDTSTIIAFLAGHSGRDVELFAEHLEEHSAVICPPVLLEALSNHVTRKHAASLLDGLKQLALKDDFWLRASSLRADILKRGFKARTADTMIAQCCIDHDTPLITRDKDFKHFAKYGGLALL